MLPTSPLPVSERLIFRSYEVTDAELLASWFNDPAVNKYFEHDPPFEAATLREAIERLRNVSDGMGLVACLKDGTPVGVAEIRRISKSKASCYLEFAVGEAKLHGQGYGAELIAAVSAYATDALGATRQEMKVYATNARMLSTARRSGFTVEGVLRASQKSEDGWVDEVVLTKVSDSARRASSFLKPVYVAHHAADLVGNTPAIDLSSYYGCGQEVFAKIEAFNPGASIKDRAASSILRHAHERGEIHGDTVIVEATSGNTSTGLALVGGSMGLKSVAVAPEGVLKDGKLRHLKALGAVLVITPGIGDYERAVSVAKQIRDAIPHSIMGNQFANQDNPRAHIETTAKEIICQIGKVDAIIAGLGSGGTLMGNAAALRANYGDLVCIAVEPTKCSVLSGTGDGAHRILGIGPGFLPEIVDKGKINHVVTIDDKEAAEEAVNFCRKTGMFVGISSGAVLRGLRKAIDRQLFKHSAVALLADSGLRYGNGEGNSCFYTRTLNAIHESEGALVTVRENEPVSSIVSRVRCALNIG